MPFADGLFGGYFGQVFGDIPCGVRRRVGGLGFSSGMPPDWTNEMLAQAERELEERRRRQREEQEIMALVTAGLL